MGFVIASVVAQEAELEMIAVAAEAHRRGLGGKLLEALLAELRAAHVSDLILEVRTSNGAAQGLYRAGGFVECGRRLRYYADPEEDAVLMRMGLL
jgi:ribosomal-protein-alanine N-acetyltransferase